MPTFPGNRPKPVFNERPLEHFLDNLCREPKVRTALEQEFGPEAEEVVRLLVHESDRPSALGALDLLVDLLSNEAEEIANWRAMGSDGPFPIDVLGLGGVYFVRALELDDAGYFGSVDDAESYILISWSGEAWKVE